jgi:hypothetical protein
MRKGVKSSDGKTYWTSNLEFKQNIRGGRKSKSKGKCKRSRKNRKNISRRNR